MVMEDHQRIPSAKNSRRRRWEVKSKESFETSLAVEIDSPQKRENADRPKGSKNNTSKTDNDVPKKEKSTNPFEKSTNPFEKSTNPFDEDLEEEYPKPPKEAPNRPPSSKPSSAKSKLPKPSRSKPSSAKSTSRPEDLKPDDNVESDLLSAKLGALIDEANAKNKDSQKRAAKDKGKSPIPKEDFDKGQEYIQGYDPPREIEKTEEHFIYSDDPPKYSETEEKQLMIGASSPEPSAPPLSSVSSTPPGPSPKRKKHRKKTESKMLLLNAANEESFVSLHLREMKDDIVDITRNSGIIAAPGLLRASSLPTVNGNINAIFQERIGGFVMTRNVDMDNHKLSERLQDVTQIQTRTSYAVFLQSGFRTFSVLCQGLLAGITLAHCLMIFLLEADPANLSPMYNSRMAHIFYALVIFLTTICFTAACDRCDLSGVGVFSGHGIKIPWTPAFYLSSLVLSLVAVRTEDVLANGYHFHKTLEESKVKDLVDWWRWICVARTSTSILAWLAVVPDPHTDALLDSIQELHKK